MLKIVKNCCFYFLITPTFAELLEIVTVKVEFYKYQGTGNDFVMIKNIDGKYDNLSIEMIRAICNRKTGVGADGLILINNDENSDFFVDYYNADGSKSFCGNGARCSVAFARHMGMIRHSAVFNAIDGLHNAEFVDEEVKLEMADVTTIEAHQGDFILDTGSPHYIRVAGEEKPDIVSFGKQIRYSEKFNREGINVNLMQVFPDHIYVETYERGVENETLSCGTGVTACALVAIGNYRLKSPVTVRTKGGELKVFARMENEIFTDIWLQGPAKFVFSGTIDV